MDLSCTCITAYNDERSIYVNIGIRYWMFPLIECMSVLSVF